MTRPLSLVRSPGLEPEQVDTEALGHMDEEVAEQVQQASALLDRDADAFVRWPFAALHANVGAMAAGDIWYVNAFSGGGKTTFVQSAIAGWQRMGKRVFVMPLEVRAKDWRVRWACHTLGVNGGDVMNGAWLDWPNHAELKGQLKALLHVQSLDGADAPLWVDPVQEINAANFATAVEDAADWGADIVVVDHIDHIQGGDGTNIYAESVKINKLALHLAQRFGVRLVLTSQLNLSIAKATTGDRLAKYAPPQVEHVYMGGHKIHVATGMLGLFRPLRERDPMREPLPSPGSKEPDRYAEAMRAARSGQSEAWTALKPHTMGVVTMKLRNQGEGRHEGARCELGVEKGRVVDLAPRDAHRTT